MPMTTSETQKKILKAIVFSNILVLLIRFLDLFEVYD